MILDKTYKVILWTNNVPLGNESCYLVEPFNLVVKSNLIRPNQFVVRYIWNQLASICVESVIINLTLRKVATFLIDSID